MERMSELTPGLERLREEIFTGRLNRRSVLKRAMALGLSAPVMAGLLAACGDEDEADVDDAGDVEEVEPTAEGAAPDVDETEPAEVEAEPTEADAESSTAEAEPTEVTALRRPNPETAGGGGLLRLLWWQAPTILNPHLAQGTKDFDASRICLEPLADFDVAGNGIVVLASEMPSIENGLVAADGTHVTWKLKQDVLWHDGEEFNAEDVKFTWEFVSNVDSAATTQEAYNLIERIEIIDPYTLTIYFTQPNPAWSDPFTGPSGMIIAEHIYRDHVGTAARDAPANLAQIGTGPFKVVEFRAGDTVLYDRWENYWDEGLPFFDQVEMKGGGDAASAARAVMETGEADYAWNLQVEPEILQELADGGQGAVVATEGSSAERIMVNFANPNEVIDGARSEPETVHPIFQFKEVRNAIALAIPRDVIATQLYGAGGEPTPNNLNVPARFRSQNTSWEFNLDRARELLSGFPETEGYNLLYQTSTNSVRQKTQEIVKQAVEELGFVVELKSIDSAVFFSSDAGNPDTYSHFYADLEMYTNGPSTPYPIAWAQRYRSDSIAQQENNWAEPNITRYQNEEYDLLHNQAQTELDPEEQARLFIAMNDLSVLDFVEIPIVYRKSVGAVTEELDGFIGTPFASDVYDIKYWHK